MYQTNSQAWDEVMNNIAESERRTLDLQDMFGQDNLKRINSRAARSVLGVSLKHTDPGVRWDNLS